MRIIATGILSCEYTTLGSRYIVFCGGLFTQKEKGGLWMHPSTPKLAETEAECLR